MNIRNIIIGLLLMVLYFLLHQFNGWFGMVVIILILFSGGVFSRRESWLIPGISISLLWLGMMLFADFKADFYLSGRIAKLFELPGIMAYVVPVAFAFIISALSGLLAWQLSKIWPFTRLNGQAKQR